MTEILSNSGSANGMKEMSICGGMRRLMPSDVRSVRLRSIRLAAHPHLEHLLPCRRPPTPCRRTSLRRPGNKTYEESTIVLFLLRPKGASVGRARMGLMGFEAQGRQVPQIVLDVHRGHLTTRQRRKAQTPGTRLRVRWDGRATMTKPERFNEQK